MRLVYALMGLLAAFILLLFPVMGLTHSSGAAIGFSGGPGDIGTCQACHNSYEVNKGTGSVAVTAPSTFVPGATYALTVTVDNTTEPAGDDPVQGFQLSVQDGDGNHIGQLVITDEDNTHFSSTSDEYVTQTFSGRLESTWSMAWIAPPAEEAPEVVSIYVAGNAADGDGSPFGDFIYTTSAVVPQAGTATEAPALAGVFALEAIFPNPVRETATALLTLEQSLPVTMTVYDGLGRIVHTAEAGMLPTGTRELALILPPLARGIYFLEILTPEGSLARPFTVVH